jgi:transposase/ferredoxin
MLPTQGTIRFSDYSDLYDIVVKKDNKWRRLNELSDFSFVYDELKDKYCPDNGRMAEDPVRMFKYLMIKSVLGLSDADLVDRCMSDMACKFFLGLAPEDRVIDSSTLSKFRRQRLKDVELLDMLIGKSLVIARAKGIEISRKIIVDSTHTLSRSNPVHPATALQKQAKLLRKTVYEMDGGLKDRLPEKYEGTDLEKEMDYIATLLSFLKAQRVSLLPNVSEKMNLLSEMMEDIADHYTVSSDPDARTGHKAEDSEFFGYKGHLAVVPERLVVAATMTSGEKGDGPELPELIRKAKVHIPDLEEVIGDGAYSGQDNLEEAEREEVNLIAKLHPIVAGGTRKDDKFTFNKDAGMAVCPAGHMAVKKAHTKRSEKSGSEKYVYYFDIHKCRKCKHCGLCGYKKGQETKSYTITVKTPQQEKQFAAQQTEEFKKEYGIRYIIEAKNSELKHSYHLDRAISYGLDAFTMQGAVALFTSNLVRILRIVDEKSGK